MGLGKAPIAILTTALAAQPGCATLGRATFPGPIDLAEEKLNEIVLDPMLIETAPALLEASPWTEEMLADDVVGSLEEMDAQCDFVLVRPEHVNVKTEGVEFYVEAFRGGFRCACSEVEGMFACSVGTVDGSDFIPGGVHRSLLINEGLRMGELGEQVYAEGEPIKPASVVRAGTETEEEKIMFLELNEGMQRLIEKLAVFLEKWEITCKREDVEPPFTLRVNGADVADANCLSF